MSVITFNARNLISTRIKEWIVLNLLFFQFPDFILQTFYRFFFSLVDMMFNAWQKNRELTIPRIIHVHLLTFHSNLDVWMMRHH